jgi:hypothetical protein
VLSVPAENALLARYSPPQWRATAFGAKFLLALGVSTIGVKLVAVIYDGLGSFAPLWLTLAGCAGFVAAAGLFLPGRLRRTAPIFTPQAAESISVPPRRGGLSGLCDQEKRPSGTRLRLDYIRGAGLS